MVDTLHCISADIMVDYCEADFCWVVFVLMSARIRFFFSRKNWTAISILCLCMMRDKFFQITFSLQGHTTMKIFSMFVSLVKSSTVSQHSSSRSYMRTLLVSTQNIHRSGANAPWPWSPDFFKKIILLLGKINFIYV